MRLSHDLRQLDSYPYTHSKYVGTRGPEARLFAPMAAAFIFPIGMFIYAWSTYSKVYWIALAIGIVVS